MKRKQLILGLTLFAASLTSAQQAANPQPTVKLEGSAAQNAQPKTTNGRLEAANAASNFEQQINSIVVNSKAPTWIGYAVEAPLQRRLMCCFDDGNWRTQSCCTGCKLENGSGGSFFSRGGSCVNDAPSNTVFIFFRAEEGTLRKLRVFSQDCGVDLGGTTLHWINDVPAKASLALLDDVVRKNVKGLEWEGSDSRKIADEAMMAIAMHADPQANKLLEKYIMSEGPRKLREQALFWAGMERGRSGFELVRNFARSSQGDTKLREHATFVLSQSREDDALTELITMAKKDADSHVRGQAIFWLGQSAGRKAASAISESLDEDPDAYVKKKAVFALSQMPHDEGVPRLIQVARSNKNPSVRKEAMFWLGQTGDPRALQFFEEVLTKQ
jgi:hypothetical protein